MGSTRALACGGRRPRRPRWAKEVPFSDITFPLLPGGAPAGTREGACAPHSELRLTMNGVASTPIYRDYGFASANASHMHARFMPHVLALSGTLTPDTRVLDVGYGNGFTCGEFARRGCIVVGIDLSESGVALARAHYPPVRFEVIPADSHILENLAEPPFDLVVSTEVVEHLYSPREWARGCFAALKPGGRLICTTPYHGYLKNLVLSLLNKWDAHANPLWDGDISSSGARTR